MHHDPLTLLVLINTALLLAVFVRTFRNSKRRPVAPTDPAAIEELRGELQTVLDQLNAIQGSINDEAARLRGLAGDSAVHTNDIARLNVQIFQLLCDKLDPNGGKGSSDKARITNHPDLRRVQ